MAIQASLNPGLSRGMSDFRSLDDVLRSGKALWVINNSEPRSLLLLTIQDPVTRKPYNLEFYRTFIPFCLTDMVPREVLEQSIQVRTFIRKGLLKIISEEEALKILGSEKGQMEFNRLMTSEFAQGAKKSQAALDMMQSVEAVKTMTDGVDLQNPSIDYTQLNLHPRLRGWESRVIVGELDGPAIMNELLIHDSEFGKHDLEFIVASQFPKEAKDFASKKLEAGDFKVAKAQQKLVSRDDDREYVPDYE